VAENETQLPGLCAGQADLPVWFIYGADKALINGALSLFKKRSDGGQVLKFSVLRGTRSAPVSEIGGQLPINLDPPF
jgi:hypothetical protein